MNKKILCIGLFILLLASFGIADIVNDVFYTSVFDTINEQVNLTFVGGDNNTNYIELPKYANVSTSFFNISSEDSLENLWIEIGTPDGIYEYEKSDQEFSDTYNDNFNDNSINGTFWGTYSAVEESQKANMTHLVAGSITKFINKSSIDNNTNFSVEIDIELITHTGNSVSAWLSLGKVGAENSFYIFTSSSTGNYSTGYRNNSVGKSIIGNAEITGGTIAFKIERVDETFTSFYDNTGTHQSWNEYGSVTFDTKVQANEVSQSIYLIGSSGGADPNFEFAFDNFTLNYEPFNTTFKGTETITGFENSINTELQTCTEDDNNKCNISITTHSETAGNLTLDTLNISLDQYLANFSFYNDEDLSYVNMTCTLDGSSFDHTSYTTFRLDERVMSCLKFGYNPYSLTWNLTNESITQNISLTPHHFNIQFLNELNGELVNDTTINLELISTTYYQNYTTTNGTLYETFTVPEDYTFRWSGDGYGRTRQFLYTLSNQTETTLIFYMIDDSNSTETKVTVYDEVSLNSVEGAIVYLQKYFIDDNEYKTVAMYTTDIAGESYFDIEHDDELYKFQVDYPFGTQKLVTEEFYVSSTTVNLYINLISDAMQDIFDMKNISVTLSYDEDESEFDVTWNDAYSIATEYCLYLKKWGQYSLEIVNSSCSTSTSGSVSVGGLSENATYYGLFTAKIDGVETTIASAWKEILTDKLGAGRFGAFMAALIIMVLVFLSAIHYYALILSAISLIFTKTIGILDISWGVIIMILIAAIILSIILSMKR